MENYFQKSPLNQLFWAQLNKLKQASKFLKSSQKNTP